MISPWPFWESTWWWRVWCTICSYLAFGKSSVSFLTLFDFVLLTPSIPEKLGWCLTTSIRVFPFTLIDKGLPSWHVSPWRVNYELILIWVWLFKHSRCWQLFCYTSPLMFWIILKILYDDSRSLNFCYHLCSWDSYITFAVMKFFCTYFVHQEMNIFMWIMFRHPEISDMILVEPPSSYFLTGGWSYVEPEDNKQR